MRTLQTSSFIEHDSEMEISTLRPNEPDGTLTLRFGRSHTSNATFFFDSPADLAHFHKRVGDWLESRADYTGLIGEQSPPTPRAAVADDDFDF